MTPKQQLLENLDLEYQSLRRLLDGLSEEQMSAPRRGWSVKEMVAHFSGWHREMIPRLERITRGERPFADGYPYRDPDKFNARFAASGREQTVAAVLDELEQSHRAFAAAAEAVPEERVEQGRTAHTIILLNGPDHYKHHAAQIRAWF